jgi:speckle-type POZ protein
MKKLTETSQGTWAPVIWGGGRYFNFPTSENGYCYGEQKPVFQLLLEFNCEKPAKRPKTEGEQHVLKHLLKLLDNQSMADITFIVKGEKIRAHSVIISLASPILGAMLKQAKGSESNTLEIEDIDPGVFHQLLRYLYTGDCPELDATEMTEQLFLAADKYDIHLLKGECEMSLMSKVTLENVVSRMVMAHQHSAPKLLEAAMKCLVHNKDYIWSRPEWMTLGIKHLELVFTASHRMVADQYCGCCGKLNAGTVQNA